MREQKWFGAELFDTGNFETCLSFHDESLINAKPIYGGRAAFGKGVAFADTSLSS